MRTKKTMENDYVTCTTKREYAKRKHVVCLNHRPCNKYDSMPTKKCVEERCEFAAINEYVCDVTPVGFYHRIDYDEIKI